MKSQLRQSLCSEGGDVTFVVSVMSLPDISFAICLPLLPQVNRILLLMASL
jgi:hypothetical protein